MHNAEITILNECGWGGYLTCGCVSQVNPDFEEESAEQRSSVSQLDLFPSECLATSCWLLHCYWSYLINLCWIFTFCSRWWTLHPLISRYCHIIFTWLQTYTLPESLHVKTYHGKQSLSCLHINHTVFADLSSSFSFGTLNHHSQHLSCVCLHFSSNRLPQGVTMPSSQLMHVILNNCH